MSKLENISDDIVGDAYDNFVKMFFPSETGVGHHFWAFLGMKHPPTYPVNVEPSGWLLPPEAARLARMLAGPNHKTIAKIMILNGYQYKEPVEA